MKPVMLQHERFMNLEGKNRIGEKWIVLAAEYMLDALKEKEVSDKKDDDYTNPSSGGGADAQKAKPEKQEPENKGTLILDATCAPSKNQISTGLFIA